MKSFLLGMSAGLMAALAIQSSKSKKKCLSVRERIIKALQ